MAKRGPVQIPIHGKAAHNAGFLLAIGGLVVNWANNESVFLAMLQCLVGGDSHTASIIWHSQRTTQARLDLLGRLVREQVKDANLVSEIERAISQFRGFSRTRNFFCHATYNYDQDLNLHSAHSTTLAADGYPVRPEIKVMDRGTMNEINDASTKLATFNREIWMLVRRLERTLGVQRVKLPPMLRDILPPEESHPATDEAPKPE